MINLSASRKIITLKGLPNRPSISTGLGHVLLVKVEFYDSFEGWSDVADDPLPQATFNEEGVRVFFDGFEGWFDVINNPLPQPIFNKEGAGIFFDSFEEWS